MIAAAVVVLAGLGVYWFVQRLPSTTSTRVEEPYKRTADKPPSAVKDETSVVK
jgi:hypothetical protein